MSTNNFSPAVWPAIGNKCIYECLVLLYIFLSFSWSLFYLLVSILSLGHNIITWSLYFISESHFYLLVSILSLGNGNFIISWPQYYLLVMVTLLSLASQYYLLVTLLSPGLYYLLVTILSFGPNNICFLGGWLCDQPAIHPFLVTILSVGLTIIPSFIIPR